MSKSDGIYTRQPGQCGHKPYAGGYAEWFCQKPRGHRGAHRFNSYTWVRLPLFLERKIRPRYRPQPVSLPYRDTEAGR